MSTTKSEPLPIDRQPPYPFLKAVRLRLACAGANFFFRTISSRAHRSDKAYWASVAPTLIKTYPIRPTLKVHIHLPPGASFLQTPLSSPSSSTSSPSPSQPPKTYPLFILIHGGGFTFGSPTMDFPLATLLSSPPSGTASPFVVVSPDYRYGPSHRFPTPLHDLTALIPAILADTTLPISPTGPVILGGSSAGGTLTLSLVQLLTTTLSSLAPRLRGLVCLQPLTDRTGTLWGTPRKCGWGTDEEVERLETFRQIFTFAHVKPGQDLRDPLLSPRFMADGAVPRDVGVFMVGSTADVLYREEAVLMRRLRGERTGESLSLDPDDGTWDVGESWEDRERGLRYLCYEDMPHTFTHWWVEAEGEEWKAKLEDARKDLWEKLLAWLGEAVNK